MKKIVAIILVCSHLFNIGGCLAIHQYLKFKTDEFFNEQAGKNLYNKQDLSVIKIPVHLEGISDWSDYEDVSGQIKFEDTQYNYIKMKITRNAMYFVCIPNYEKTQFTEKNIIEVAGIKDIPVPKKEHVPVPKLAFVDSFNLVFSNFNFNPPLINRAPVYEQVTVRLINFHPGSPEEPPKKIS
ncbi:hypothetical protein [Rubrolithibacter danxiaensis]|uniref:hypothetical protein n=1 Tax=Rubrolithibacter danxiaensis TaxID=3390805 RepID=UPI003BF8450A